MKYKDNSIASLDKYVKDQTAQYVAEQRALAQKSIRPADGVQLRREQKLAQQLQANRTRATRAIW